MESMMPRSAFWHITQLASWNYLKANLGLWFKFSQEWLASRGRTLRDTRCSFNVYCDSHVATTGHKGWLISCQVGKEDSAIYCQLFFIDVIYVSNLDEEQLHWMMLTLRLSRVKSNYFERERNGEILWDISNKGLHLMMLLLWCES